MFRLIRTLWTHKKKTIFFSGIGYWAYSYVEERHRGFMMMRKLGEEAKNWGNKPLPRGARNKHITLILNPVCCNRKGKTKFEKFGEPLIHLSGFLVNIVTTEKITEARDLVGLVDRTNIIAVVGGDGSVMEVITGLLRREDADEACERYPIAVIPAGVHNTFANKLFNPDNSHIAEKDVIAEAAMSIGRHNIVSQDVVEVTKLAVKEAEAKPESPEVLTDTDGYIMPTEEMVLGPAIPTLAPTDKKKPQAEPPEELHKSPKPYYSMSGLQLGHFREADKIEVNMPQMFNRKFCTVFSLLRAKSDVLKAEIRYVPYCNGCLKCKEVPKVSSKSFISRIVAAFHTPPDRTAEAPAVEDEKWSVENPICGTWESICVSTPELNILPLGEGKLEIQVGSELSKLALIQEGYRRRFNREYQFSDTILCREVEVIPVSSPPFCSIDNEEFPVIPLKMKILRNKVKFFAKEYDEQDL